VKIENPSAFPTKEVVHIHISKDEGVETVHNDYKGMTLRDYFANGAMMAILSNSQLTNALALKVGNGGKNPAIEISEGAYTYADAMLSERSKGVQP
jgi:hypothetical protein